MVTVLNNAEVESLLDIGTCLTAMEEAYGDVGVGKAINRPRSHIPNKGEQLVRYYGAYSNVSRGREKRRKSKKNRPRSRRSPLHPFLRS